ncbi:MAG: NB-ARC domain-containing protein [Chloroflexi bacterium]|nr:NB-ARC domain-containing protein [Chloroflexota bacterium]
MLEITLLGRPQIKLDQHNAEINANKALALIYYLAATERSHSRQSLAALLWSDLPEEAARRNLRVELARLKGLFEPYLIIERDALAFNVKASYTLDVAHFEARLRQPEPTFQELQEAVALYQGDFLEDFHLRDAPLFEEWMENERERLRQAIQRAILRLGVRCLQEKRYSAGIDFVDRLLGRAGWLEEAHQVKMHLLARSGQRAAALAQYELCCQTLEDEFGVPPSDETNELYDQILSGEIGPEAEGSSTLAFAAPSLPLAPPFQAPQSLLHFVGREKELQALQEWLAQPDGAQAYALVGMGGLGKSTLAIHFAHALRHEFPDGVLWAHVASSEPLDILGNWARAYGYDFSTLSDVENRAAALRSVLADKQTLIVLDDVRSVARTRPLLLGGAQCATLITTRDQDVAVALNAHPHVLKELTPAEGYLLLTRILGEARVAAEPASAQEICTLLQNLPLAVEITAQRLASRPRRRLGDMAERLRNVQERLDLSISDRAVRTSFTVSWDSLDTQLRHIFALLGLFEGRSFTAPALAYIAGVDKYTAEDRLFALTALSLLSEDEADRYRQHPLLADFAYEQLGDNVEAKTSLALYYQTFADQHRTNYAALRPEWENMMEGMRTAHTLQAWPLVLDYADTLTEAWFVRARYAQARRAYAWVRDAALALANEEALATCLLKWGQACIEQNDHAEANVLLAEGIRIYEKLDHTAGIASINYYLARISLEQANYDIAEQLLVASQRLREQLGDRMGLAAVMYQEAFLFYRRGDFNKAKLLCEDILSQQEQIGDKAGSLPTLRLLADIALEQKTHEQAHEYCRKALSLCEELQDRGEMAATYYILTILARLHEQFELAQTYAEKAIELCRLIGNRLFQALTLYELSKIYAKSNHLESAITVGLNSADLLRELKDSFNLVYPLRDLGTFYLKLGNYEPARVVWQEALAIAQPQAHPETEQLCQLLKQLEG